MIRTSIAFAASAATVLAATNSAHAQMPGEVLIEIDQPVLAPGESTTVRLLAGYDSAVDFAMGRLATDLLADSGGVRIDAAWSDADLVPRMDFVGTTPGVPDAGGYAGIIAGQFHWWQDPGATDRSDPIAFWEATFTAPTDADAFAVDLSTMTTSFIAYPHEWSSLTESRFDGLTEGSGTIFVVPTPASALVFFGLLATRRRASRPAGASRSNRPAA